MDVIVIFDLGTASTRLFLFDSDLNIVYREEQPVAADPGKERAAGIGGELVSAWMRSSLRTLINTGDYKVRAVRTVLHGPLTGPCANDLAIEGPEGKPGETMHESYASLVPYLKGSGEPFILAVTGTWCIFMNPFNTVPVTADQSFNDATDCIMNNGQRISTSRFLLGHIHDMNVSRLDDRFGVTGELFKTIKIGSKKIWRLLSARHGRIFFREGIPPAYVDYQADLSHFLTYADAYHQMVFDLVDVCMESYRLIIPPDDTTRIVYVTGGFARNDTFVRILAAKLPDKRVFASQIENPAALGAAMSAYKDAFGTDMYPVYLGLKAIIDND